MVVLEMQSHSPGRQVKQYLSNSNVLLGLEVFLLALRMTARSFPLGRACRVCACAGRCEKPVEDSFLGKDWSRQPRWCTTLREKSSRLSPVASVTFLLVLNENDRSST